MKGECISFVSSQCTSDCNFFCEKINLGTRADCKLEHDSMVRSALASQMKCDIKDLFTKLLCQKWVEKNIGFSSLAGLLELWTLTLFLTLTGIWKCKDSTQQQFKSVWQVYPSKLSGDWHCAWVSGNDQWLKGFKHGWSAAVGISMCKMKMLDFPCQSGPSYFSGKDVGM